MNTSTASPFYPDLQESKTETQKETSHGNQKTDNTDDKNAMKPGSRLRHAREQKNISVEQIANKLFLDVNVIKALEIDDYTSLPSTIFVRGYLRNYAKVLDIPPEAILESYEYASKKDITPAVFTSPPKNQQTHQANSNSWWVKAVTVIMVIAAILLVVLWGINRNPPLPTPEEPKPIVNLELKKPQPTIPPLPSTTSEATPPKTTPPTVTDTGNTPPAGNSSTATEESSTGTSEGDKNPTETESASAAETTVPEIKKDPGTLKVFLKKGMWMMITDKTNKPLHNATAKEDGEVSVTGTPPFKMRVSRTDGVAVEYLGQKTDFTALPTFSRKAKQATIGTISNP